VQPNALACEQKESSDDGIEITIKTKWDRVSITTKVEEKGENEESGRCTKQLSPQSLSQNRLHR